MLKLLFDNFYALYVILMYMKKYISALIILFFLLILPVSLSFAATLQLTKIGALDTGGKSYSEWWYTGPSPLLVGKATSNSDVKIKVDRKETTVKSSSSGDWSYQLAVSTGNVVVNISQGSEAVNFTLHLGQSLPATTAKQTSQSSVPNTGSNQMLAIMFGGGLLLLGSYLYFWGTDKVRA